MAWTDVNFDEVNTSQELVPEGTYTFMVCGANRNKFDSEKVDVRLEIATQGPYAGQPLYLQYPNPEKVGGFPANDPRNWVMKAFKAFVLATGHDMQRGEHPVEFVSRIVNEADAQNTQIYIEARVTIDTFPDRETGEPISKNKVALRSVKAASVEVEAA